MIILYNILNILLYPFIYFYLIIRKLNGKEDAKRFSEKFGYNSVARPEGDIIWIHVASVGEYQSVKLLVNKLINKYDVSILITSITVSSAKLISAEQSPNIIHQYLPVDNLIFANRFVKYWQPRLVIWVESELWPITLKAASKTAPILSLNSKLSDRSYLKWCYAQSLLKSILSNFTLIFPQSKNDLTRFEKFSSKTKYIGNLKYCAADNSVNDVAKEAEIKSIFDNSKKYILAASTHATEERIVASAYKELKKQFGNLFLVIAPRHPSRRDDIIEELSDFNIGLRSNGDLVQDKDIYMVDTIGELKYFYPLCDIVFVGGSLINIGGHNPLEPAKFDSAIIYGHDYSGCKELIEELLEVNAVKIVSNSADIVNIISKLLENPDLMHQMQKNAKNLLTEKSAIIDNYLAEIDQFMK